MATALSRLATRFAPAAALAALLATAARPGADQLPPHGGAPALVADLTARREKTMATLGPEAVLVVWSAPTRVYSGDVNYEYRQDSNLRYLTGIVQEDTVLVLVPGARQTKEVLFVRQADPQRALWYGRAMTPAEISAASGIATVYPQRGTEVFEAFMAGLFTGRGFRQTPEEAAAEFGAWFDALRQSRARLGILEPLDCDVGLGPPEADRRVAWARQMQRANPGVTAFSARDVLTKQRQTKTPYEQAVLTRSVEISALAHVEGMRVARPGRWEYEVEAAIEASFLRNGAMSPGYPSIVGSGPNATVLHYLQSTRQMRSGDLLLVDAAGSFQGVTGDITRTYPVSGRFTADQRVIYDLVLRAQDAGIAAARPGVAVEDVTKAVRAVFADGLAALGLVRASTEAEREAQIDLWFPHGPVHGIGMDVHEPIVTLDPGAAFVIEPGLYMRSDAFDRLPKTEATAATAAALAPALDKYRDIGVRIEDSFLMTASGPVMLSAKAPRRIADIERVVGRGR